MSSVHHSSGENLGPLGVWWQETSCSAGRRQSFSRRKKGLETFQILFGKCCGLCLVKYYKSSNWCRVEFCSALSSGKHYGKMVKVQVIKRWGKAHGYKKQPWDVPWKAGIPLPSSSSVCCCCHFGENQRMRRILSWAWQDPCSLISPCWGDGCGGWGGWGGRQ